MPFPSSDELYALAAQAGMVPQEAQPEPPMPGLLAPPDVTLQSPPAVEDPGLAPGASEGGSQSQSVRGFDASKLASMAPLDRELAVNNAASTTEVDARFAEAKLAQEKAATSQRSAEEGVAKAKSEAATAQGEDDREAAKIQDGFTREETRLTAEAAGQANVEKANYVAALADFRASKVDPSQLWSHMSGGQQFGMLISAFVTDYLGAKGIKTSAMDTFNKAIDRNIDSQIQAIKTKGEVAQGFKDLWYMQRSQSASDAEARTRVRGFMLEGAKATAAAHMSKYNAGLATAQGAKAMADIDKEQAENTLKSFKYRDDALAVRLDQNVKINNNKRDNAQAAYATSSANKRAQDALDAAKPPEPDPTNGILVDKEDNKGKWVRKGDTQDKEWAEVKNTQAEMETVQGLSQRYMDLVRKHGNQGPLAGTRWSADDDALLKGIRAELFGNRMLYLTGKASNEQEVKLQKASTPEALWTALVDISPVLAQTELNSTNRFNNLRTKYAWDVPGDKQQQFAPPQTAAPLRQKELSSIMEGTDKPQRTATTEALEHAATPAATKDVDDKTLKALGLSGDAGAGAEWETYANKERVKAYKEVKVAGDSPDAQAEQRATLAELGRKPGETRFPGYAAEVTALLQQANGGDSLAVKTLVKWAKVDPSNPFDQDPVLSFEQERLRTGFARDALLRYKAPTEKPAGPPSAEPGQSGPSEFTPSKTKYYNRGRTR